MLVLALAFALSAVALPCWADDLRCSPAPRKDSVDFSLPCVPQSPIADSDAAILFERGSARLTEAAMAVLDRQAQTLRQHPGVKVRLVGWCDTVEAKSGKQRQSLSRKRAAAALDYLVSKGVEPQRLHAMGKDYTFAIPGDDTDEAFLSTMRQVRTELAR